MTKTTKQTTDTTLTTEQKLRSIPPGKVFKNLIRGRSLALCRRNGDSYEVQVSWAVPEAFDDDHQSFHGSLSAFSGRSVPEVGWCLSGLSLAEAVSAWDAALRRIDGPAPAGSVKIGNVSR